MPTAEFSNPITPNVHWRLYRFLLRMIFYSWLRYGSRGTERLPAEGGALFLINHQSFLDPFLVGLPIDRPVSYLARDSLFRIPVIRWVMRNTYVMPINREAASTGSLREAIRRLEHGFFVGIFPEGTRSTTGDIGPLKPGFLALMRRAKVPVYPIGIAGAFQALPRGAWFLRPAKVRVVYGAALSPEELSQFGKDREAELLEFIRERMLRCQLEAEAWRSGTEAKEST